jgi:3-oxoacyl-ACP reductase-like protein
MTAHSVVRKFAEMIGLGASRRGTVTVEVTIGRKRGPVTRTFPLPDGKSMKVIRKDTFDEAVGRAREVA